ncbi:hypothetical protein BDN71DRAFT_1514585 [Pleurotus eryngii]|uniref:Uncharacterized protein n=1 Tax=Pleurotus eryngii TaxID=5323 RepID=A0A9P5ZEM1_PLEER|nr:hypothetical protein BDN71DRAFT_1514585 [Pleurotus eryngii]
MFYLALEDVRIIVRPLRLEIRVPLSHFSRRPRCRGGFGGDDGDLGSKRELRRRVDDESPQSHFVHADFTSYERIDCVRTYQINQHEINRSPVATPDLDIVWDERTRNVLATLNSWTQIGATSFTERTCLAAQTGRIHAVFFLSYPATSLRP